MFYSAIRQKFSKLWTSVAHSFLQQIAQNKNRAHPKANTLPRICKVEMQQASLLYYSAKLQSGGIWGVCPTSLYVRTIRFPTFCRSLPSVGAYSQYPAWSHCCRSADVTRADHDRVGRSPWQGGFKDRDTWHAIFPFVRYFRHLKIKPPLSSSSTKRTLRQDPLEAILVIFGRRALFFLLFESSWKNMKNDTTFVCMRSCDHLGDTKMSKKGTSLRRI